MALGLVLASCHLGMKWACTCDGKEMRFIRFEECRWSTVCCVAGLLVVVAVVLMKFNLHLLSVLYLSFSFSDVISPFFLSSLSFSPSVSCSCLWLVLFIFLYWPRVTMNATNEKQCFHHFVARPENEMTTSSHTQDF